MLLSGIQRGQMFILIKNFLSLLGWARLTMSRASETLLLQPEQVVFPSSFDF